MLRERVSTHTPGRCRRNEQGTWPRCDTLPVLLRVTPTGWRWLLSPGTQSQGEFYTKRKSYATAFAMHGDVRRAPAPVSSGNLPKTSHDSEVASMRETRKKVPMVCFGCRRDGWLSRGNERSVASRKRRRTSDSPRTLNESRCRHRPAALRFSSSSFNRRELGISCRDAK